MRSPLLRIPSTADIAPLRRRSTHPGRCWLMLAPRDMRLTAAGHTWQSRSQPHAAAQRFQSAAPFCRRSSGFRQQSAGTSLWLSPKPRRSGNERSSRASAPLARGGRAWHAWENAVKRAVQRIFFYSYWASSAKDRRSFLAVVESFTGGHASVPRTCAPL